MSKISVSKDALGRVLQALVNPAHHIAELQATRKPTALFPDNPINQLVAEFNAHDRVNSTTGQPDYIRIMRHHANKIYERVDSAGVAYESGGSGLGALEDAAGSALYLRNKLDEMLAGPAPTVADCWNSTANGWPEPWVPVLFRDENTWLNVADEVGELNWMAVGYVDAQGYVCIPGTRGVSRDSVTHWRAL